MAAETKRIKVVRAFMYQGKAQRVGSTLDVPALFAIEMVAANKAEHMAVSAPEKPKEPKPEPKAEAKAPEAPTKGGQHAGK